MTDAEKKRKGLGLAEGLLQAAERFEHEFQHREMAQEARSKAIGVLEAMRYMGLISQAEYRNRMYMAGRPPDDRICVTQTRGPGEGYDVFKELMTEGRAG